MSLENPSPAAAPPPLPIPPPQRWGFWATCGLFAAMFAGYSLAQSLGVGAVVAVRMMSGHPVSASPEDIRRLMSDGVVLGVATLASLPVALGLPWLFALLRCPPCIREQLGLRWPTVRELAFWTGAQFVFLFGVMGAGWVATRFYGRPDMPEFMRAAYLSAGGNPLLWFAVLIAAPMGEELMFRGFLFPGLARSKAGPVWAAVISSAVWAAIHMQYDLFDLTEIFLGGLLLSAAWWRTRSVYLCIALHSLMNLLASAELVWKVSREGLAR